MVGRTRVVVLVGAMAMFAGACGGASGTITASGDSPTMGRGYVGKPTAPPAGRMSIASLRQAASNATAATSGRLEMSLIFSEPGGPGEVSMTMSGSYTVDRSQISTQVDMTDVSTDAIGGDFADLANSEMIVVGEDAFVRGGVFSMLAGETATKDTWLKMPSMGASEMTSVSPDLAVEFLDGAYGEVTEVGPQDIRGVATTHYRVMLDPEKLIGTVAADLALSDLGSLDGLTMDLFVGSDGLMRRMTFAPDIEGVSMSMTVDYFDLGLPVAIEAPTEFTEFDPMTAFGGMADGFEDLLGDLDSAD